MKKAKLYYNAEQVEKMLATFCTGYPRLEEFRKRIMRAPITRDTLWKTQDGRLVAIREMTDSHLLNTLRVLRGLTSIS